VVVVKSLSPFGGMAIIVPASDYVSTFRGDAVRSALTFRRFAAASTARRQQLPRSRVRPG
jgi:hypothetical protein